MLKNVGSIPLEGMCKEPLRILSRFVAKIGKKSMLLLSAVLCVWKVITARELIKAVIFTTAAITWFVVFAQGCLLQKTRKERTQNKKPETCQAALGGSRATDCDLAIPFLLEINHSRLLLRWLNQPMRN